MSFVLVPLTILAVTSILLGIMMEICFEHITATSHYVCWFILSFLLVLFPFGIGYKLILFTECPDQLAPSVATLFGFLFMLGMYVKEKTN